ncbi:MAG: SDR family NAD(P)-dependent oxidoreductase [Gammaproteobacteria bacterium]|nr:SDR family NAD(P)-dependent oxidoreductase [Gammaproteobacteria bacterium]
MKEFAGKTAVITGGASGIGFALAQRFADAQMNVVLADIEENALEKAVKHFEDRQQRVLGVVTNTMRRESIEELRDRAVAEFGNIHVLCNNAGVVSGGDRVPIWEISDADWDWVMGVNFNGVLYGMQAFLPHMIGHGEEGHVVSTASVMALVPGGGTYGVSKHGVLVISEALHRDLKAAGSAIGASVLCPGWVDTKIGEAERNRPADMASASNPQGAGLGLGDVLKQGKSPAEVAEIVFQSIVEDRFYILPHAGWDDSVRGRVEAILARGAPGEVDMGALVAKRAEGQDV